MTCFSRQLHPIYGAVPRDGEFVEAGDILGMSPDADDVVVSPLSGWVRLIFASGPARRQLTVEIWQDRGEREQARPMDRSA